MASNLAYKDDYREEIIGGEITFMSPRPAINHNRVAGNIYRLFANFLNGRRCEMFGDGVDLFLSEKNRFIPDGMVVCNKDIIKSDGVHGTPDLVIEVLSPSTARNDRLTKKKAYEEAGVQEYWIVEPTAKSIEVHMLKDGKFEADNVYTVYHDFQLERMTDEERAEVITSFQCSLYSELSISLDDVFYGVS